MMDDLTCACGAKRGAIELWSFGKSHPTSVAGPLLEPCTCPKCIVCGQVLDNDGRCDNLDCTLVGVHIVEPD